MKKTAVFLMSLAFALPTFASAASLTSDQANAIVGILEAFGVDQAILLQVEQILGLASPVTAPPVAPSLPHVPVVSSFYRASNLGFDYSYNAPSFPPASFGFGVIGVSGGKSFTQNPRLVQEFNWANFGSGARPTFYMNLNAPYGTTVAGHVSSPENCPTTTVGTTTDPTACAGYNYGYNAAASALAYTKSNNVSSPLWWLDIETANSWSPDASVNDQVIQGAIDYLNSQGIRAGIYSMPYMWNTIAGTNFVPTQIVNGQQESLPLWIPIGISDQIGAGDYCSVGSPFVAGSPIWIVQYETSPTAVDQNFSC